MVPHYPMRSFTLAVMTSCGVILSLGAYDVIIAQVRLMDQDKFYNFPSEIGAYDQDALEKVSSVWWVIPTASRDRILIVRTRRSCYDQTLSTNSLSLERLGRRHQFLKKIFGPVMVFQKILLTMI